MSAGISDRKKEAAKSFADLFDDSDGTTEGGKPTPEAIVVSVMHGIGSNQITDRQLEAAKMLLPYRLPKLNTVEAHVATEGMTHEEWIASLDGDGEDDE